MGGRIREDVPPERIVESLVEVLSATKDINLVCPECRARVPVTIPDAPSAVLDGTNVDATFEDGEPDHSGGGRSVWYRLVTATDTSVKLHTCPSYDSVLAVYTGATVDGLTLIADNDDDPTIADTCPLGSLVRFVGDCTMPSRVSEHSESTSKQVGNRQPLAFYGYGISERAVGGVECRPHQSLADLIGPIFPSLAHGDFDFAESLEDGSVIFPAQKCSVHLLNDDWVEKSPG